MRLTIVYNKGCFKSRFLRALLRSMEWELIELDASSPRAQMELAEIHDTENAPQYKHTPGIYTNEVFIYELYPLIEYLNERGGNGLFPVDPTVRVFYRIFIHRTFRDMRSIWNEYIKTGDENQLIDYVLEQKQVISTMLLDRSDYRTVFNRPSVLEVLLFSLMVEYAHHRKIQNPGIEAWYKSMLKIEGLAELADEPALGYKLTEEPAQGES